MKDLDGQSCPPVHSGRPESIQPPWSEIYDWLAANGVDEWIPEDPTFEVRGGELTYLAYRWEGERRGWDTKFIAFDRDCGSLTEWRTVPLLVAPPLRLRELSGMRFTLTCEDPD